MNEPEAPQQLADPASVAPAVVDGIPVVPQAFISYASPDSSIANAVCNALERAGVKCWIAPRDVTPGDLYAANIVHAIDASRVVVLVLSQHAADSAHVLREVERASSKRHPILSFRIDLAPLPDSLQYFLNTSQWLDASATGVDRALPRLIEAVKGALGKPAPAALVSQSQFVAARSTHRPRRMLIALGVLIAAVLAYVGVDRLWLSKRDDANVALVEVPPAAPQGSSGSPVTTDRSIAVLPFVNMSSDKEQEYFSDGISEELLNLLAKIPELRVVARTSSFSFKGKNIDISEIARKLGVANVLEGSVRKSGNKVRITAQLIRATDSTHLWSETFDREISDIFAVQDEIAGAVVDKLKITLLAAVPTTTTVNPEAYTLFLQARHITRQFTNSAYEDAIRLLQRAIKLDDSYAAPWVALADVYLFLAIDRVRPVDESIQLARAAIDTALKIDPNSALVHGELATIAIQYDSDLGAAARHLEHAFNLEPANLDVIGAAAFLSRRLGRLQQAIALGKYQVARDPANAGAHDELARAYMLAGQFDASIAEFRAALRLSPSYPWGHGSICEVLLLKGDARAALAEAQLEVDPMYRLSALSLANYALGQKTASDAALGTLIAEYGAKAALDIATTFAYRGELDRSFEWLDKAFAYHDLVLNSVAGHPTLANLHNDPRWLPFLRKINMGPEQLAAIKFEVSLPK